MDMNLLIEKAPMIIDLISHVILSVVVIATIVVRITPTKADDKKLSQILVKLHKFMSYMPTLGRNPQTKELMKMSEDASPKEPAAGS